MQTMPYGTKAEVYDCKLLSTYKIIRLEKFTNLLLKQLNIVKLLGNKDILKKTVFCSVDFCPLKLITLNIYEPPHFTPSSFGH